VRRGSPHAIGTLYSLDDRSGLALFVSELELFVSDESEELELVLELGELFTDLLDSVVVFLLQDLVVSELVAGADELDIELLLSAGAEAAVPEPSEELDVLWAKLGTANAIAAARVEALTMKPSRDFISEILLAPKFKQPPYHQALCAIERQSFSSFSTRPFLFRSSSSNLG
jgi:hypothetical protein